MVQALVALYLGCHLCLQAHVSHPCFAQASFYFFVRPGSGSTVLSCRQRSHQDAPCELVRTAANSLHLSGPDFCMLRQSLVRPCQTPRSLEAYSSRSSARHAAPCPTRYDRHPRLTAQLVEAHLHSAVAGISPVLSAAAAGAPGWSKLTGHRLLRLNRRCRVRSQAFSPRRPCSVVPMQGRERAALEQEYGQALEHSMLAGPSGKGALAGQPSQA